MINILSPRILRRIRRAFYGGYDIYLRLRIKFPSLLLAILFTYLVILIVMILIR